MTENMIIEPIGSTNEQIFQVAHETNLVSIITYFFYLIANDPCQMGGWLTKLICLAHLKLLVLSFQ